MTAITLGLRENWQQFSLLVVVNAFVGAMVGLERSVLSTIASSEFGVASTTAALSFIVTFGLTKAFTNLAVGRIVDATSRRPALLVGWLIAVPVPLMILWAPNWTWIVAANALLGVNQGLTWSTTIIMKIDLVGPRNRGLAMGLNEFSGYLAVGAASLLSGIIAASYNPRAGIAHAGLVVAITGFGISLFARDTTAHARLESRHAGTFEQLRLIHVLTRSLWSDRNLFSISQAGLVNNLNDGLAWGLFPLLFVGAQLGYAETGVLAAVYPVTWGVCQLYTGAMSDRLGRKWLIVAGMVLQGAALIGVTIVTGFSAWLATLAALGVGTALVYPTLLAAVGDIAPAGARGTFVGVYRLWRDLGYVAGALLAGALADAYGIATAINAVGVLTAGSGIIVALRMTETRVASPQLTVAE